MKSLSNREKILLGMLLIVGIGYLYYNFLLNPMIGKINSSKQTIAEYNTQLQDIENVITTNEEFKGNYDSVMEKYKLYSARMPYSYRDPEIAFDISELAAKSSSEMKSINFTLGTEPLAEDSKLIPITVNISVESTDYLNAINFINSIETDTRMAQIKSLSLVGAADQASGTLGILVNLGLEYYYVKDDIYTVEYDFNNESYGKSDLFK